MAKHGLKALLLWVAIAALFPTNTLGFVTVSPKSSLRISSVLKSTVPVEDTAKPSEPLPAVEETVLSPAPGRDENEKFQCDSSVDFWRDFESQGTQGNLRLIRELLAKNALNNRGSDDNNNNGMMRAAYWSSQMLRTSYFMATGGLGLIGSDLHQRFVVNRGRDDLPSTATSFLSSVGGGTAHESDTASRSVFEVLKAYEQDWNYVESGLLNIPWDGFATASRQGDRVRLQLDHKQSNPLFALLETGRVIQESIGIFSRQNKHAGQASGQVWMDQPTTTKDKDDKSTTMLPYPDYYLNDFHYQTDGWLSSQSANAYEAGTETLFWGRQDAMQRQTLIPLLKHFGSSSPPKKILDVAAGTGRFATFVRDNFPQADMTITDLSPFYLEKARENDKYWRSYRGERALKEKASSSSSITAPPKPARFVQANAESLPFADESFDAVTCVYLFHELPLEARENAAREMARVVKPGGMVSFSDSIQTGDIPAFDRVMGNFGRLNEPHYEDYRKTSLAPLFERHGLVCSEKYVSSSTKTLSFVKPVKAEESTKVTRTIQML